MRARVLFMTAAAAAMLCGPAAADKVAQTVETIPTKKIESATADLPAKSSQPAAESSKVAAVTIEKPAVKTRPKPTSLKAHIDLSSQTMTVKEHGQTKYVWKISSGRKGYYTPTGNYRPQWMTRMHYSKKYDNAPMPHSVFYHGGFAVHATYATGALGRPASHGCIRLSPGNAKKFYNLVSKHGKSATRIAIVGSTPKTRTYAKRKTTKKKTYSAAPSYGFWGTAQPKKPAYKPASKKVRRKPAKKSTYSYSTYKPSYVWPGDRY